MLDALTIYWAWVVSLFSDPRVAAAIPCLVVSWGLNRDLKTTFLCTFVAYSTINLIIWLTSIPFGGDYTMPVPAASGVGTTMALLGLSEIQTRVRQTNLRDVLKAVIYAVKEKRK